MERQQFDDAFIHFYARLGAFINEHVGVTHVCDDLSDAFHLVILKSDKVKLFIVSFLILSIITDSF